MPNLRTHAKLFEQYGGSLTEYISVEQTAKSVGSIGRLTSGADQSYVRLSPDWLRPFHERESHHVVLTFVDIAGFSKATRDEDPDQIAEKLDKFYAVVIPALYRNGGVVEKVIGDGIIGLFGYPFIPDELGDLIFRARRFGIQTLEELNRVGVHAKVALHDGVVMYYSPLPDEYLDYTVIGEPLTELFRLETVAREGAICVFDHESGSYTRHVAATPHGRVGRSEPENVGLQGLGLRRVLYIQVT